MSEAGTLKVATPTDREIVITRAFDAPREQVWRAMTEPDLIRRWCTGPPGWEMTVCENDLTVGGAFRHEWRGPDGAAMAMHGVYQEIEPPARIVRTATFEFGCDAQAGEQKEKLVLAEQGGRTMLTLTLLYPSKEARDATIASGMEQGVAASYDRLDEIISTESA